MRSNTMDYLPNIDSRRMSDVTVLGAGLWEPNSGNYLSGTWYHTHWLRCRVQECV
jgi:hypothetical protein